MFATCPLSAGIDFIRLAQQSFTLPGGVLRVCRNIEIINDSVIEDAEDFTVSIASPEEVNRSAVVIISDTHGINFDTPLIQVYTGIIVSHCSAYSGANLKSLSVV